jgi:hypothetical protein
MNIYAYIYVCVCACVFMHILYISLNVTTFGRFYQVCEIYIMFYKNGVKYIHRRTNKCI